MLKLFAGLALACVVTPAFAQDCTSTDKLMAHYKAGGDKIIADVKVKGNKIDRLIIDADKSVIWLFMSEKGCMFGPGVAIGLVAGGTLPKPVDAPPIDPPKPQGGGAEIGI